MKFKIHVISMGVLFFPFPGCFPKTSGGCSCLFSFSSTKTTQFQDQRRGVLNELRRRGVLSGFGGHLTYPRHGLLRGGLRRLFVERGQWSAIALEFLFKDVAKKMNVMYSSDGF